MIFRRMFPGLLGILLLACGMISWNTSAAATTPVLARIHWLGLDQISADTNSTRFMKIWHLPETVALEAQTLDKLSRWLAGGATNAASAKLRPLLDDFVSSEFYLEFHAATNSLQTGSGAQPSTFNHQLCFALHLPADRAQLWQNNLAEALRDLTGIQPAVDKQGWMLTLSHSSGLIECTRHNGWTVFGVGQGIREALPLFTKSLSEFPRHTNFWMEADLDPLRLAEISTMFDLWLGANAHLQTNTSGLLSLLHPISSTFNHCHLTVLGKAGNVFSRGILELPHSSDGSLPAWEIPTNLIHGPLTSFTAIRGFASWLSAFPAWQELHFSPTPDQAFMWVQDTGPLQACFALPLPASSNQLAQAYTRLMPQINSWLATNADGHLEWRHELPGVAWTDIFVVLPYLKPVLVNHHDYVVGGVAPFIDNNTNPPPAKFVHAVLNTTNLVYYHAEQTGERVEGDLFISQTLRLTFHKPQLPFPAPGTSWLKKIKPLLGGTATTITQTGPQELNFVRSSTFGFTALELHLLTDWLESPQFPYGLHTFIAPPNN